MKFCQYGTTKTIGKGIYYICSETGYPCKFARWCATTCEYKPNASLNSCRVRTKKNQELAFDVKKSPVIEEPIIEEIVEELVDEPVEEPVKKSRKRTKNASDE